MTIVMSETPEAAHAASEIEPDDDREVSGFFSGLMAALGLTAAALLIAHLIARWVL
jgi:hypothetical protein